MAATFKVEALTCLRQTHTLFANLSFELNKGDVLLIEGANGAGKSSLLRLLVGLATPVEGNVSWEGKRIQQNRTAFGKELHYLSHTNGIKLGLTVAENLQLAAHLALVETKEITTTLSLLQMETHQNTPAGYLSAGQKRRVALAKLWLFPKTLWILDEPLTALDQATQTLFLEKLTTHALHGGVAIISSHHPIALDTLPGHALKTLRLGKC